MITLFHGTTLSAAERILDEGWTVQPPQAVVAEVAAAHGLDPLAVTDHLTERGRFAAGETRGSWASFSLDEVITVHGWAQRAPEVRWEALWAVWRLGHPEVPFEVEVLSQEGVTKEVDYLPRPGEAWVFQQMRADRLALITLSISYDKLIQLGAMTEGFEHKPLPPRRALGPRTPVVLPGVAIPAPFRPSRSRLELLEIDRDVPWTLFAELLGIEDDQFQLRDRRGEFGPPASRGVPRRDKGETRPWWLLSAVEHLLPC
jgi:hypothetical protein